MASIFEPTFQIDGITEGWKIKTEKQEGSSIAGGDFDLKYGLRFFFHDVCRLSICLHRLINYIADVFDYMEKFHLLSAKNESSTKVNLKTTSLASIILQTNPGIATNVFRADQAPPRAG